MRRLVVGGGLWIAAGVAGALLSSGAASARQAAGTIAVSGVANGTSIAFTGSGSPFVGISFEGGSNWKFTAISSAGGSCSLTPTNNGAFCSFQTPVSSFVANTTISGPIPSAVTGQVGYADASTGTFSAPVTPALPECHCSRVHAKFTDFKEEDHDTRFVFALKLEVRCAAGNPGHCAGTIDLAHPKLPPGLKVRENKEPWHGGPIRITCHAREGTCPRSLIFTKEFELLGLPEARGGETISFPTTLFCVPGGKETHEDLELKFDRHGNLNRRKSRLGKL